MLRIITAQGWYIGMSTQSEARRKRPSFAVTLKEITQTRSLTRLCSTVCYTLGIYLLNIFLAFLQPKIDPSLTQDEGLEDGSTNEPTLPTKESEEFRPFIRRLPEFKFWHQATRATAIAFVCTWFRIFDVPVFWPVLVMYFIILFSLTSKQAPYSATLLFFVRG